jgi:hypothetical protein
MLADFQQALADLVASPDRCRLLIDGGDPEQVFSGFELTARELARLVDVSRQPGMAANCTIYRSNRLTPIVVNFPDTCTALGTRLRDVMDRFWAANPTQNFVHFLVEADRFATFLVELDDDLATPEVLDHITRESAIVRRRLTATLD